MCILAMDEVSLKAHLYYDVGTDEIIGLQNLGWKFLNLKLNILFLKIIYYLIPQVILQDMEMTT